MDVEPQTEHRWLQKLVGEWTYESEATMAPDAPPVKFTGSERVRSLGGLWVVAEGEWEMPDGVIGRTMMTLGYDPDRKRYVGTWVGSMMTFLWIYDGERDASGRVLTLEAEGPTMTGDGKMTKYQDVIELVSDDHRILRGRLLADDGQWHDFMTTHYRRAK